MMSGRKQSGFSEHDPRRVIVALAVVITVGVIGIVRDVMAQKPAGNPDETYRRPEPTAPFTPQIPSAPN